MYFLDTLFYVITALLGLTIIVKTYLFFTQTSRHKYLYWLYFNKYAIYKSRNEKTARAKRVQNFLSFLLLVLLVLDLGLYILSSKP